MYTPAIRLRLRVACQSMNHDDESKLYAMRSAAACAHCSLNSEGNGELEITLRVWV